MAFYVAFWWREYRNEMEKQSVFPFPLNKTCFLSKICKPTKHVVTVKNTYLGKENAYLKPQRLQTEISCAQEMQMHNNF